METTKMVRRKVVAQLTAEVRKLRLKLERTPVNHELHYDYTKELRRAAMMLLDARSR